MNFLEPRVQTPRNAPARGKARGLAWARSKAAGGSRSGWALRPGFLHSSHPLAQHGGHFPRKPAPLAGPPRAAGGLQERAAAGATQFRSQGVLLLPAIPPPAAACVRLALRRSGGRCSRLPLLRKGDKERCRCLVRTTRVFSRHPII